MLLGPLQTSLLQDTIERASWHVYPEFPGHRDRAGLHRMLKLPMTTLCPNVVPPVLLDEFNYFSDLHIRAPILSRYRSALIPPHRQKSANCSHRGYQNDYLLAVIPRHPDLT
jgi:hypothetical protein